MELNELLRGLNPEQRDAVTTIDGPVLVLAGAGTGKTRVITVRMAYMLATGIPPERILGMTFTNKAAREMRERLAQLVPGGGADKVTLGTFHSFCVRILRREISALNYPRAISPLPMTLISRGWLNRQLHNAVTGKMIFPYLLWLRISAHRKINSDSPLMPPMPQEIILRHHAPQFTANIRSCWSCRILWILMIYCC